MLAVMIADPTRADAVMFSPKMGQEANTVVATEAPAEKFLRIAEAYFKARAIRNPDITLRDKSIQV